MFESERESSAQIIFTETSKFTSYETTCLNIKREIYDRNSKNDTKHESVTINILNFYTEKTFQKVISL